MEYCYFMLSKVKFIEPLVTLGYQKPTLARRGINSKTEANYIQVVKLINWAR